MGTHPVYRSNSTAHHFYILFAINLLVLFFIIPDATATSKNYSSETDSIPVSNLPNVYLDCDVCDRNYIRQEIRFINYVRDYEQADIHIFVTTTQTGGGGREYQISFIGRNQFKKISFEIAFQTGRNATPDEVRSKLVAIFTKALQPYMLHTSIEPLFTVNFSLPHEYVDTRNGVSDPWNYWTFEIYLGSLNLNLESNQKRFGSRWGVFANHVTEDWKVRIRPYFNYSYREISRPDSDPIISEIHRHGIETYAIKSINQHWSAGMFFEYVTRNDRNLRHDFEVSPGLEYSLWPYEQAARKAITFTYNLGYKASEYYEETIFGKMEEQLFGHSINAGVRIQQPWGSISGNVQGSHYFHDFSIRRAQVWTSINVRLTEGLNLNFYTNFQMIQDQLSLPGGDATVEDVLLAQRQLQTDYTLYTSIALTYRFGSQFVNVVNTRF